MVFVAFIWLTIGIWMKLKIDPESSTNAKSIPWSVFFINIFHKETKIYLWNNRKTDRYTNQLKRVSQTIYQWDKNHNRPDLTYPVSELTYRQAHYSNLSLG